LIVWLNQKDLFWAVTQTPRPCTLAAGSPSLTEKAPIEEALIGGVLEPALLTGLPLEIPDDPHFQLTETALQGGTDRYYHFNWFSEEALEIVLEVPEGQDVDFYLWQPFNYGMPDRIAAVPGSEHLVIKGPRVGEYVLLVRVVSPEVKQFTLTITHDGATDKISEVPVEGKNKADVYLPPRRPLFDN
jgi:hypothetical protein